MKAYKFLVMIALLLPTLGFGQAAQSGFSNSDMLFYSLGLAVLVLVTAFFAVSVLFYKTLSRK